jgi:hypothetical protein
MDEFNEKRLSDPFFSSMNPKDVQETFKAGKSLAVIGVTEKMINAPTSLYADIEKLANFRASGTEVLLHEEWAHARTLLLGQNTSENDEHKIYHGFKTSSSPSAKELLNNKYSLTNAGKAIKQIQSIAQKCYKKI